MEHNNLVYTINGGKWYAVERDYVKLVNDKYNDITISDINFKNSMQNEHENKYNERVVQSDSKNFYLMDTNVIYIGEGQNKIEFCDIITKDKKIIHVKRKISSSTLSHLFNQGVVSSEMLKYDSNFIEKVNTKILNDNFKISISDDFEIVYAIISDGDMDRPYIPFFSRVTLNNTVQKLKKMNYKVSIRRIPIEKEL